jgi:hypothetical protein
MWVPGLGKIVVMIEGLLTIWMCDVGHTGLVQSRRVLTNLRVAEAVPGLSNIVLNTVTLEVTRSLLKNSQIYIRIRSMFCGPQVAVIERS